MQTTKIARVLPDQLDRLREFSELTFREAFEHLNDPVPFENYMAEYFSPERVLEEYNNSESEFYFMKEGKTTVGYMKLNTGKAQSEPYDESALEIQRIYVGSENQGNGYGRALLEFAEQQAEKKKAPFIWLGVWEHNQEAIAFYKRHGFKTFDRHQFDLGGDIQTDVLMRKEA